MRNTTTVMAVLGLALTTVACDRLPTTPPEQYIGGAQEAQTRLDKGPLGTLGASRFRGGGVLALAEEFGLTSEQVAEIEAIVAEAGARTEPILEQLRARARQDGFPPGPRGRRARMDDPLFRELREIQRDAAARIRGVLTDEQVQRLHDLRRSDREAQRGARPPRGIPLARILKLSEELGLTADQIAGIEVVLEGLRAANEPILEQQRARRNEGRPYRWGRGSGGPDSPAAAELHANVEAAMEKIRGILTADQLELLGTLFRERGPARRQSGP